MTMSGDVFNFKLDPKGNNYGVPPNILSEQILNGDFPTDELMYKYNHNRYVFGIEGLDRAVEICQMSVGDNGMVSSNGHTKESGRFCGTKTFEETIELTKKGWPEGLKEMNQVSEAITEVVGSRIEREVVDYDISGEEVDPVAFATGEIECMCNYSSEIDNSSGKCVNVVIHMGVLGNVNRDTIINRGATIVSVLSLLKNMGYSTKAVVVSSMEGDSIDNFMTSILIKDYQDQIDEDLLAFCMCNPSMHRRINFSLREHMEAWAISSAGLRIGGGCCSTTNIGKYVKADITFERTRNGEFVNIDDSVKRAIDALRGCKGIKIGDGDE